ncbi:MAG TPA: DUF4352 domain-containing protein [Dehalococcoidia bacterium]
MRRSVLLGMGVLLAAGVAAGVFYVRRDGDAGAKVTPGGTTPEEAFEPARPAVLPGGLELTVVDVDFDAWRVVAEADPAAQPPGRDVRMVLVRLRVANTGERPLRVAEEHFAVLAGGRTYSAAGADTACGAIPEALDADLQPGEQAVGRVCARVPAGETGLRLVWSSAGATLEQRYFVLGDPAGPPAFVGGTFAIRRGTAVEVRGTGDCLNIRTEPSVNAAVIQCAPDGTRAAVAGGPQEADGYRWWNLAGLGWAAEPWLAPVPE